MTYLVWITDLMTTSGYWPCMYPQWWMTGFRDKLVIQHGIIPDYLMWDMEGAEVPA